MKKLSSNLQFNFNPKLKDKNGFLMKKKSLILIFSILSISILSIFLVFIIIPSSDNLQFYEWYKIRDEGGNDRGKSICFDDNNSSVYIAGYSYYYDSQEFSPIIIQYDRSGRNIWEFTWDQDDSCKAIAVDNESNLYVGGDRYDFVSGNSSFFLMKLNKSKQLEWGNLWGLGPYANLNDIALDSKGNVYAIVRSDNLHILRKYDSNGAFLWEDSWVRHTSYISGKIDVDSAENVYVTGSSDDMMYLMKYNSTGDLEWLKTYGTVNKSIGSYDIVVDSWDNIYTCGFEYTRLSTLGSYTTDAFMAKFNASGVQIWNKTWGGSQYEEAHGVDVDSNGYLYITGYTTSFEYQKLFVLKYSAEGIKKWSNALDISVEDYGSDILVNSIGEIYVVGNTYTISGGTNILTVKMSSEPPPSLIHGYEAFPLLLIGIVTIIIVGFNKMRAYKIKR